MPTVLALLVVLLLVVSMQPPPSRWWWWRWRRRRRRRALLPTLNAVVVMAPLLLMLPRRGVSMLMRRRATTALCREWVMACIYWSLLVLLLQVMIGLRDSSSVTLWSWLHGSPRPRPGLIQLVSTTSTVCQIAFVRANIHATITSLETLPSPTSGRA